VVDSPGLAKPPEKRKVEDEFQATATATAYVVRASARRTTVTPVATATNTAGKPINIGGIGRFTAETAIAITPVGKTAYIATAAYIARSCAGCSVGTVIPVATATNTAGRPIKIGRVPKGIAITR
jgi:DNA-binding beta-propeller fold protein YncE